nr:MAG TPA: hypothetical protein [Bacteriophage sp.]
MCFLNSFTKYFPINLPSKTSILSFPKSSKSQYKVIL